MTKMEWAKAVKFYKHKAGAKGFKTILWYILGIIGIVKAIDSASEAGIHIANADWCETAANSEEAADDQEVVIGGINLNENE